MNEQAIQLGRDGQKMTGILSVPPGISDSAPVILMFNAGVLHRVGPFRLWVDIARQLAAQGLPSLRFDLHGLGDSPALEGSRSDPFEQATADLSDVMDEVERRLGKRRFIVFGLCSGADYAHPAAKSDPRIQGLVLIDGYGYKTRSYHVHRQLGRVLSARRWKNLMKRTFLRGEATPPTEAFKGADSREFPPATQVQTEIEEFLAQGRRLLFIYTDGVPEYFNHETQFWEMFPRLKPSAQLKLRYFARTDHTFALVSDRKELAQTLVEFVSG
ncbi:MAG: alpha/beta fold hydrolase [Bdellovibrionota bacterium]